MRLSVRTEVERWPIAGQFVISRGARTEATVVVADTAPPELPGEGGDTPAVRYQVLCRRHHVRGELGPTAAGPGQLALP